MSNQSEGQKTQENTADMQAPKNKNPQKHGGFFYGSLKNAPHTQEVVISDDWDRPYSREKAAYPLDWVRDNKFFASVSRVDEAYGDRNLICTCAPIESYM